MPGDVEHQTASLTCLAIDREAGELLECLENLAVLADQVVQMAADDLDRRAITFDVHVDVSVKISDVEQSFEEVRGDIALLLEPLC